MPVSNTHKTRNMKLNTLLLTLFLSILIYTAKGQDEKIFAEGTGTGTLIGISEPLKNLPVITDEEFIAMEEKAYEKILNPKLRTREFPYAATALPKGPDGVWQKEHSTNRAAATEPVVNFIGINSPYFPPDDNGTAGPNHYMQTVNTSYAIFSKTGTILAGPTNMNLLFGSVPGANCNDGDPIILYDEMADRWLAAEFSLCGSTDRMLVAVSTTNDPTGTWYQYSFPMTGMPDYEKFGIWHDGYYMGTNTSSGRDIYVFEREVMLAGGANPKMVNFDNPWRPGSIDGFMMVPPVDCDGTTPPPIDQPAIYIAFQDDAFGGGADQLWIYELNVDWTTTSNSTWQRVQQLNVEPFDSNFGNNWNNIKQPGTSQELDAIPQVVMNVPQYRNWGEYQSLVCCHTVDVDATDHAGIRWYELRKSGSDWTIRQQGTYAPDIHSRWMGSITMNGAKEIALGYSVSSTTVYPGIRFTGQTSSEYELASGIMDVPEGLIHEGTQSQTGANRWGDYSLISVDPADDETFWYTNQYNQGGRKTKIAAFNIGPLGPNANFTVDINTPCINQPVQFTDLSTASPISWEWSFNPNTVTFVNGTNANSQNPQVSFNALGSYSVTLTATNEVGSDTQTNTGFIEVNVANADFIAPVTTVSVNNPVTINDLSSCEVTSWNWNFGEGASPATANTPGPHFVTYSTTGTKTVTLTVNGSITETKTNYISVVEPYFIMNNLTVMTCNGTFMDPGNNSNYGNNLNYTTTFYPSQPGGMISVDFSEFYLEPSTNCVNDYLSIYNGVDATAPLIGKYCGTITPGLVTAENESGALTFVFRSNSNFNNSGWIAEISCSTGVLNPGSLNALAYTDTRIELDWELNPDANNVMLLWSSDGNFGIPVEGNIYTVGQTVAGGGTVIYTGNNTAFSHLSLLPSTTYHYKIFSINGENAYSNGLTASATTLAAPPMINVTPTVLNVEAAAGSSSYTVVSNTNWTATSDSEWCDVTLSGIGNGLINVSYDENLIGASRTATITVNVLGLDPLTVTLIQAGAPPTLILDPLYLNVETPAGTADVIVTSNAPWTVSTDTEWCTVTPEGLGNGIITIQFTENVMADERTALFYVNVEGLPQELITLVQAGATAVLSIEPALAEVSAQAGTTDFNVTSNFDWSASSDATWLTIPTSGTGNAVMNAVYSANMTLQERSAIITIEGHDLIQQASVIQAAGQPMVFVSPENIEVSYLAGTTVLTVTSNTDWTVTENADWLTTTSGGTGNGSLEINYNENETYIDRTTDITVAVTGGDPVIVVFTQTASTVGIEEFDSEGLRIYPNPAGNQFVLEANAQKFTNMTVSVSDPAGLVVLTRECNGSERHTFDVSKLSSGTYMINIKSKDLNISRKLVIIK